MNPVKKIQQQINMNKDRALFIAKSFIPEDSKALYYKEICNGCQHDDKEEFLECCYCQDGNCYMEDEKGEK